MDDDDKDLERILGDNLGTNSPTSGSDPSTNQDKDSSGSDSDGLQGSDENRTEADSISGEGDSEAVTPQSAENSDRVDGSAGKQGGVVRDAVLIEDIEEAIQYAKKYLEDLLSFFGLNTEVHATTEDKEVIELDIPSTHLNGFLIGHNGETMRALQYTISNALRSQNYSHTRVNVDVAEYKKQRAGRLVDTAESWFKEVKDTGKPKELQPMNAADRRVVHQAATDYGLLTESVGFGRDRHIVLKPGEDAEATPPPEEK
jgi:spoIIIJ-associated protein